jgi:hypothetical protein
MNCSTPLDNRLAAFYARNMSRGVLVLLGPVVTAVLISQELPTRELPSYKLIRVLELKGTTYHVQGADFDREHLWLTSVDTPKRRGFLHEFSLDTGELTREIEIQDGDRFHPGGISADGDWLWIPVAEYRPRSSALIQRRRKNTLALEFQFEVPDHIGCLAARPDLLIGGNWDSKDFYFWSRQGELLRKAPSATGVAYQDMKYDSGWIIGSGNLPDRSGAIDWLEYPSLQLVRRVHAGKNDRGVLYTREAMAIHGNRLILVPEDGPSRVFVFDIGE